VASKAAAVSVNVKGKVAQVWLERPQALNALSPDVVDGLLEAVSIATAAACSALPRPRTG